MEPSRKKQKAVKTSRKSPKLLKQAAGAPADVIDVAKLAVRGGKKARAHNPNPGICGQCRHTKTCTYPKPTDRPVLICDEFEGYPMRAAAKVSSIKEAKSVAGAAGSDGVISLYRGLCSTCEKRDNCDFPKPEGGVWHCEEYE